MPEASYYDLMVLLDPEAPEERRAELVEQIKRQIDSGNATLKGDADWGMRRLSFEIDHRREAQYHLFQFQAAADLLSQLDRSLSIEDGVLRHRIIRLPGEPPETTPKPSDDQPRRTPEAAPEAAADVPAEAPAEAASEAAPEAAPEEASPVAEPVAETPAPEAPATEPPAAEAAPADSEPSEAAPAVEEQA
jgi:small subunit ribosomal protein S6